jgi:hypothetical protein
VVEEWTNPALGGSGFSGGGKGPGGTKSKSGTVPGTGAGDGFDPAERKAQLVADRLAAMNYGNAGETDITELPPEVEAQIDEQVAHEAAAHGVNVPAAEPEKPLSAGQRWARAFGMSEHDGNMSFSGFKAKAGTDESWFASEVPKEERDAAHITADIGLMSHDQNSADWHDWVQGSNDQQTLPDVDAGHSGPGRTYTEAERKAHGRPSQEDHPFNLDQLDLDELSTRLYDRLRSRMRLELLVDRERSGRLTDFR